jgi:hypothetical protein
MRKSLNQVGQAILPAAGFPAVFSPYTVTYAVDISLKLELAVLIEP